MKPELVKGYHDTSYGQLHSRLLTASGPSTQPTLVCLHPAPSSGLYFTQVMPLLNENRTVLAPDYPGYGGSHPIESPPQIDDYARAVIELLLSSTAPDQAIDLLGFHTGCLVANEIALRVPARVRRLVLIDVPFFSVEQQISYREKMTKPLPLSAELSCLNKAWNFNISRRLDDVPIERAFALFTEQLRAGTRDSFGFHAAFSYDCVARFARLQAHTTILATRSGLLDASHAAAEQIPGARLIDVMDIDRAVFEASATVIAPYINSALTEDQ